MGKFVTQPFSPIPAYEFAYDSTVQSYPDNREKQCQTLDKEITENSPMLF